MPAIKYFNKEGKRIPSVTTILGQWGGGKTRPLMIWANKLGLDGKSLDEGYKEANIGTLTHKMVEHFVRKKLK